MTERSPRQRLLMAMAGWLVAAVLATGVTLAAISSMGAGIFGTSAEPMAQDEIARALSAQPAVAGPTPTEPAEPRPVAPTEPSATGTPTPGDMPTAPGGEPAVIVSPGGTAVAQCTGGLVELLSWSPAQGYQVDRPDRGPDDEVEIEFESDDLDVEVTIRCVDGVPEATIEIDD